MHPQPGTWTMGRLPAIGQGIDQIEAGDLRGPWQVQSNEDGSIAATVYDEQLARLVASLPGVEGGPEPECAADCECRR